LKVEEVVLPVAEAPKVDAAPVDTVAAPEVTEPEAKPEKTPEQREIERLRRGIDRKTRQLAETRARLDSGLTQQPMQDHNRQQVGDSETVSLSRADAQRLIEQEAAKLAPTIASKQAQDEQARSSATALRKELGDEFEELTDELSMVFSAPRQLDVLRAKNPAELVRYLTNEDNADEAAAIARMSHFEAGYALAELGLKLKAERAAREAKPQPSKIPPPLEAVRGSGPVTKTLADMPYEEFVEARKKQLGRR
jgi:hypothetical protein